MTDLPASDDASPPGETAPPSCGAAGGALDVFRYVVSEKVALYRRIVEALVVAKSRYRIQLRVDEVARGLREIGAGDAVTSSRLGLALVGDAPGERGIPGSPVPPGRSGRGADGAGPAVPVESPVAEADIESALDQLAAWGNVRRSQDVREAATLAEFHHRRSLYQMTTAGEEAHRGVVAVDRTFGESGGRLSAVMLPAIVERLEALRVELAADPPDARRLYSLLKELHDYTSELAANARRFMNDLSDALDALAVTDEGFLAYKRAVLEYLQVFIAELDRTHPRIRTLLDEVERLGTVRMFEIAATADEAPARDGTRRGPVRELAERWRALRAWFTGVGREEPEAEHLRGATLGAISRILLVLERLNERRFRRVSRGADFVRLATWFAAARDSADAHALFVRAFGLHSSRHFHLAADDEELGRGASWWTAPPVTVSPRLRATGRLVVPTRAGALAGHGPARRAAVAAIRIREARATRAAMRFTGSPLRLSEIGRVDADEFAALLSFLDAALRSPRDDDGVRRATVPSGQFRLTLSDPVLGSVAVVEAPHGRLRTEDRTLTVTSVEALRTAVVTSVTRASGATTGAADPAGASAAGPDASRDAEGGAP